LKVCLFIWSHNFRLSMSLSLSPNSLYRQTTDCTEGKIYMCLTKYSFHIIVGTSRSIWDYFPSSIKFCRWGCSVRLGSSCTYHVSTLHRMPLSFCRGSDRMVVGFTTTYAISSYHHWCCEFKSPSGRGIQHYVIKFVSDLRQVGGILGRLCWMTRICSTCRTESVNRRRTDNTKG
jgi:hypothetical protein